VVLIGKESERPYVRPPLSKGYLLGKQDKGELYVHNEGWYAQNCVELTLGRRVIRLDRSGRQVEIEGGDRLGYSKLLLATGASPRRLQLPGADLDGICYLRRIEDSQRLREAIRGGGRVVVVGGGWIGLETAAAAGLYGCEVTIIEPQPAPLQAALGPGAGGSVIGGFFAQVHRQHGVNVRLGTMVTEFRGTGHVTAVLTDDDGHQIPADVVIVGVGVQPDTELADQAGLAVDKALLHRRIVASGQAGLMGRPAQVSAPRSCFAGFRFPPEVIMLAVRWYLRYGLSYRDVEELLAERGIQVDHVTIYRWVQRFTPLLAEAARPCRHGVGDRWWVDETYVKVSGQCCYVYRAIDQFDQIIDVYLSQRRDTAAARWFFTQALNTTKVGPPT
jgi:Pyridine nucleotide-disulphide oxidoreductase/DDE domain